MMLAWELNYNNFLEQVSYKGFPHGGKKEVVQA